jgi:hypothetical protein
MGPRKKSKQNANAKDDSKDSPQPAQEQPAANTTTSSTSATPPLDVPAIEKNVNDSKTSLSSSVGQIVKNQIQNRASWYGSWKGKAHPTAEVARESIEATPQPEPFATPKAVKIDKPATPSAPGTSPSPRRYLSGSSAQSLRGTPLAASMTNLNITSDKKAEPKPETPPEAELPAKESGPSSVPEPPLPPDPSLAIRAAQSENGPQAKEQVQPTASSGWFGWWSRPDGYVEKKNDPTATEQAIVEEAKNKPLPGTTPLETPEQSKILPGNGTTTSLAQGVSTGAEPQNLAQQPKESKKPAEDGRSWFGLWSRSQSLPPETSTKPTPDQEQLKKGDGDGDVTQTTPMHVDSEPSENSVNGATNEIQDATASINDGRDGAARKATGWAFWSSDATSPPPTDGSVHKQVGELAVANTPSQSNPEAAQFNEQGEPAKIEPAKPATKKARGRQTKKKDATSAASTPTASTPTESPARKPAESTSTTRQDLLLPQFATTYSLMQQPSVWQQIREYFVGNENQSPHLHLVSNPQRIKKAVAIGIHGFFPSPIIQKLIGPPTGTSIRFANHAAQAIKSWTEKRGYECEIEKVALEGEGVITDRIDTLWKLLLNWVDHIRSADYILVACHSQGVPVAIMLIAKLIQFGCIPSSRLGICAMAGVNLGPFTEYKTRMFGGSALELFDFTNPSSRVSKMYLAALETVLMHGVKVVYVGSLDDQLVSLEVRIREIDGQTDLTNMLPVLYLFKHITPLHLPRRLRRRKTTCI